MRRFLIVMALFLMMADTVDSLLAEPAGGMQTEVIDEEETPQAARRNQDTAVILALGAAGFVVFAVLAARNKEQNLRLFVNSVDSNGDGSYTVKLGYANPNSSRICYDRENSGLKVRKGTAIVLKNAGSSDFEPGIHKDAIITVINDETEMEWFAGKQKIDVNGQMIKIERREENEQNQRQF